MEDLLVVEQLSKNFNEIRAVQDLSFRVQSGQVYGFLGQNGAGKSTTLRMLLTLIRPTAGTIHIFGKELAAHRREILRHIGAVIEKPDLYKYLTAEQNLKIFGKLSGIEPGNEIISRQLDMVGLKDRKDSKVKTYSQGMKQRLGIACALVHQPRFIILDEPTNGLDPQGIADIRNLILHLSRDEGKTVLVSSHLLSEIELIADSMLIIDQGRKVAEGSVQTLLNPADTLVHIETTDDNATRDKIGQSQWARHIKPGDQLILKLDKRAIPALARYLVDSGTELLNLHARHSLEDYFLSLTTRNQHVETYKD